VLPTVIAKKIDTTLRYESYFSDVLRIAALSFHFSTRDFAPKRKYVIFQSESVVLLDRKSMVSQSGGIIKSDRMASRHQASMQAAEE